jgi:hypothetical protein
MLVFSNDILTTVGPSQILTITALSTNPIVATVNFAGQQYTLEYPNKQAALDNLAAMPDEQIMLEVALNRVLKKWQETDPNFDNLAGLLNKTCTITAPGVMIV